MYRGQSRGKHDKKSGEQARALVGLGRSLPAGGGPGGTRGTDGGANSTDPYSGALNF